MKRRIRLYSIKTFAVILSLLMIFYVLPSTVYAEWFEGNGEQTPPVETETATKDVFELKDRREESVKHFRMEDGSIMAVQYADAVHRPDGSGKWQDIDNTLSAKGSEFTTSDARVKFAKKITGNEVLFTLHEHNRKITMSLDGAKKKTAGAVTNTTAEFDKDATQLQKLMTLDKLSAKILYADILDGVDLEYVAVSNDIKENIIVKERKDNYTYTFTIKLNNLEAELTEVGSVVILDPGTKETVYVIPAPIVYDANNIYAAKGDAYYTLTESGNNTYSLSVIVNADWMNDAERAFPVVVDPPIYSNSNTSILDLDLFTTAPDYVYPDDSSIYVSNTWRAYWKYTNLPSIPASAYISDAKMSLDCHTQGEQIEGYVAVYDVLTDWDDTLTWRKVTENSIGLPANDYTDFQELVSYREIDGSYYLNTYWGFSWNVTPIVKKWYSGYNYGMMFAPAIGTSFIGTAKFHSNNYNDVSKRPKLCITYRDMKGVENYWSFSSQSAGFAGVGSVNNATGNLVFSIPTLTSTDALMPFTPTLIYNSAIAGTDYTYPNVLTSYWGHYEPKGFKLNIHETLLKLNYVDKDENTKQLFVWADGDGTEHYFLPTSDGTTYTDEDGLLLTLVENTSTCTITDTAYTIRTFNKLSSQPTGTVSGWYLKSITDKSGNQLSFGFEAGPRPTSVNLIPKYRSSIEQLRIAYDNNYNPYIVWNPTSNEAVIFRYSNTAQGSIGTSGSNYLRQAIRLHGTSSVSESEWRAFYDSNSNANNSKITVDAIAEYTYDEGGYLLSVSNNLTKYRIQYTYDSSNRVGTVKEWALVNNTSVLGQQLSFTYNSSSTDIRTSGQDDIFNTNDDLISKYFFDIEGRTVGCYTTDLSCTQIYGASYGQYASEKDTAAKNSLKTSAQTAQQSSNYLLNGNFEETASGSIPYWNKTGTATGGYGSQYEGESCAKLTVNSTITLSSISQTVLLSEGDYALSFYINTHEAQGTTVQASANSLEDSSHSVTEEVPVNAYYATGSYAFFSINFHASPSIPGTKEAFTVSIKLQGTPSSNESIWIDNVMLSKTTGSAEYDLLKMGHFESNNTFSQPSDFWKILGRVNDPITVTDSGIAAFGDVLKIDIDLDEYEFVQQTIPFATDYMKSDYNAGHYYPPNDPILFTLSGWAKGTAQAFEGTSLFGFRVTIRYYDGSQYGSSKSYDFNFDKGVTDWQFLSGVFQTDPSKGMLDTITVMIMYNDNPGVGYFDNISLVMDSNFSGSYQYNRKGYLTSNQAGRHTKWYQYDENDNLICVISSGKSIVEYTYDSNHRVKKETHKKYTGFFRPSDGAIVNGSVTELYYNSYGYNSHGQLYYVWTYDLSDTTKQTVRFTEYNVSDGSHIFGTIKLEMDALSNITRYFHDENTGRLLAVVDPEGNGVSYEYDAIGNLIQVLPASIQTTAIQHEEYDECNGCYYYWTEYIYNYRQDQYSASVTYSYDSATMRLDTIATESTEYSFVYDVFGNTDSISIGNYELVDYDYHNNNGKLNTLTYGNGRKVKYIYDALDRISEIQYNKDGENVFETVYSYTYDSAGNLFSVTDEQSNQVTLYKYDAEGKLVKSYVCDTDTYQNLYGTQICYDDQSRVFVVFHSIDYSCPAASYHGTTYYDFSYYAYLYSDATGKLNQYYIKGSYLYGSINPTYDAFGRTTQKISKFWVNDTAAFYQTQNYQYKSNGSNRQSGLVSQVTGEVRQSQSGAVLSSSTYQYTYDKNGNITQIKDANNVIQYQYAYDDLGQLIREDNHPLNKTYTYTYDNAGNRTSTKTYAFTTGALGTVQYAYNYTYGDSDWGDLLTAYSWQTIEYDEIGNPTFIGEKYSDYLGGCQLQWDGRQLVSYQQIEAYDDLQELYYYGTYEYTYNADGIRTSKTIDGIKHNYYLDGTQITAEMWTDGGTEYLLEYLYDEIGSPIGMKFRKSTYDAGVFDCYFFEKNLQGDIIAIYNSTGTKIGTYTYDAWGYSTYSITSGISTLDRQMVYRYNPFRYRGYYYDIETGFYYLNSRYYNPNWGRFISADGYVSTGTGLLGYNMFAYCNNNPVMYVDPDGDLFSLILALTLLTVALAAPTVIIISDCFQDMEDISYSNELYNSDRGKSSRVRQDSFVEKSLWYDIKGGGTENGSAGFISAATGLDKGTYSWKYFEMEFGCGRASASASTDVLNTGFGLGAKVESVYGSASIKIPFNKHQLKIGVSANLGGIGAECKIGATTEFGVSFIGGGSFVIAWEKR